MGHNINTLIGRLPINIDKVEKYGLAVAVENNYAIVFLDDDHLSHWSSILDLRYYADNEDLCFGNELVHFFAQEIGLKKYVIAYLSSRFYGVLYNNAIQIVEGGINLVLKELGVNSSGLQNEFDQLNLDEYRQAEVYYWRNEFKWEIPANVIVGHIEK